MQKILNQILPEKMKQKQNRKIKEKNWKVYLKEKEEYMEI